MISQIRFTMEPTVCKVGEQFLDKREILIDAMPKFTNKYGTVSINGWRSYHYQALTRVSLPIYSHSDSILNEELLKSDSYKSFKQLAGFWFCLITRMFSEDNASWK